MVHVATASGQVGSEKVLWIVDSASNKANFANPSNLALLVSGCLLCAYLCEQTRDLSDFPDTSSLNHDASS